MKRALTVSLVAPVRQFGDQVRAFRVVWRVDVDGLVPAWEAIVARRRLCDQVVAQFPALQMFVSCISGVFNTSGSVRDQPNPVYPAVSYWVVCDGAGAFASPGARLTHQFMTVCPTAEVKEIKSLRNRPDDALTADCSTLFIALKDHNSGFIYQKTIRSLQAEGIDGRTSNATLNVVPRSKYLDRMTSSVVQLRSAGLYIELQVLEDY